MTEDTIVAIATPLGEGALAVIRVSGKEALRIADLCFTPAGRQVLPLSRAETHTVHYGYLTNQGKRVDEVLALVMRAPRTFTREDIVEFTCHGGILVAKLVLEAVLQAGARAALPGEFTKRAFLNGRIDLTQAEAVLDLIQSKTQLAVRMANEQLSGKLSQKTNQLRDMLMHILAHIEAHIDFPEEDITPDTRDSLLDRLRDAENFMRQLLKTADEGRILRRGVRLAIVGAPNVGKSSLLNQLLGHERAIVSPQAGTTRDTIEETANIRGLPVVLVDTAGLRAPEDEIEKEGIRRTHASSSAAEVILQVIDVTDPGSRVQSAALTEDDAKKKLIVRNKIDLPHAPNRPEFSGRVLDVSCRSGSGIEALKDEIAAMITGGEIPADAFEAMINSRHQHALVRGKEAAEKAIEAFSSNETLEIVALELRIAVNAIGEIVGQTSTEDLLDSIFSQFCLGK